MTETLGQLAALATSFAWSVTSIFFTLAGQRVGSVIVNRTRLLLAIAVVIVVHLLTTGQPYPLDAEPFRWVTLGLSGIIGYVIGDGCLFQAFLMVGPRLSMLMMSLAPIFSTLLAWVLLGETLSATELLGIALAVGGVALVVSDKQNGKNGAGSSIPHDPRIYWIGILFGLGASLGQAGGAFLSKLGLANPPLPSQSALLAQGGTFLADVGQAGAFSPISGNLLRLTAAAIVIWIMAAAQGRVRHTYARLREQPRALWLILGGALTGPFIGVTLSLIAIQNAPLGVASTLMSLMPIILLPVDRYFFKNRFGWAAIAGTVLAVIGIAVLFLV